MAFINLSLFITFLCLQLTIVFTKVSWERCESESNDIKVLDLIVSPDPVVAPGSISVIATIYTNQKLTDPATALIKRKVFIFYVPIPCVFRSCEFDDVCTSCKQCNCPKKEGIHTMNITMKINSIPSVLAGDYAAQIDIETSSKGRGCIIINNIFIEANK
ncbi:unnamed protein product [Rotaria sp. Silwood2]|nr:unnamed protein product [Rotaria sp. Silwood2]